MSQITRFLGNIASSIFSIIIALVLVALWIGLWVALTGWIGVPIALGTGSIFAAIINGIRNAWINAREQRRK